MKLRNIGTRVELLGVDLSDLSVISEDCWLDCMLMFGTVVWLTFTLVMALNLLSLSSRIWSRLMFRPGLAFLLMLFFVILSADLISDDSDLFYVLDDLSD